MATKNIDIIAWMVIEIIKQTKYPKNLKIQKLIYIYEQEIGKGLFRKDFKSNMFGPYSEGVFDVIDILIANKYIKENKFQYIVTQKSKKLCDDIMGVKEFSENVNVEYFYEILKVFKEITSKMVVKYVYNQYKEHLGKSIIIGGIEYKEEDYEWIRIAKNRLNDIKEKNL